MSIFQEFWEVSAFCRSRIDNMKLKSKTLPQLFLSWTLKKQSSVFTINCNFIHTSPHLPPLKFVCLRGDLRVDHRAIDLRLSEELFPPPQGRQSPRIPLTTCACSVTCQGTGHCYTLPSPGDRSASRLNSQKTSWSFQLTIFQLVFRGAVPL